METMVMLDILAYGILLVAWIFGGALLFNVKGKYGQTLISWLYLNTIIVGVTLVGSSIIWAIARLFV